MEQLQLRVGSNDFVSDWFGQISPDNGGQVDSDFNSYFPLNLANSPTFFKILPHDWLLGLVSTATKAGSHGHEGPCRAQGRSPGLSGSGVCHGMCASSVYFNGLADPGSPEPHCIPGHR